LRGVGAVLRWGKTIAFTEGELYDAEGQLLAKASGTALPTPFKSYK
jgi:acyl-coenzyme A thioesterase PaaI-like protein